QALVVHSRSTFLLRRMGLAKAIVFVQGFSNVSRIPCARNSFFVVSITSLERASVTGFSLPGRCSNRSGNSCMSSYHLHNLLLLSLIFVQLVNVLLSVSTIVHLPANNSGYFRRLETTAKSSLSLVGHFCSSGERVLESHAKG